MVRGCGDECFPVRIDDIFDLWKTQRVGLAVVGEPFARLVKELSIVVVLMCRGLWFGDVSLCVLLLVLLVSLFHQPVAMF